MKTILKLLVLPILVLFSFHSYAQNEKSLLWKISGNGLKQPSYIFGTIHMICDDDYIMTPTIENALKETQRYCAEINLSDMKNMVVLQKEMQSNEPLSERLSKEEYAEMKELIKKHYDMDIQSFEKTSFMGIMSMLTMKSFECKSMKMYEMEFLKMAIAQNKSLDGLETAEEQINFMKDSMTKETIFEMLRNIDQNSTMEEMVKCYVTQDVDKMAETMKKESYMTDSIYAGLLSNRNKNWVEIMPSQMKETSIFYAVGSGHLGGEMGVLELLRQKGYKVEPVDIKK